MTTYMNFGMIHEYKQVADSEYFNKSDGQYFLVALDLFRPHRGKPSRLHDWSIDEKPRG